MRAVLLAAGASALIALAAIPTAAGAYGCVYTPSGGYYTTTADGNDPSVTQNVACYVFYMSRYQLNPSYQYWRGWLHSSSGVWSNCGWVFDGTVGDGPELCPNVAPGTNEHAQTDGGGGWRNEEYH